MKILIITTFFPPDTTIAAVRPYMFAKYLSKMGYDVTVLRSGEINAKVDDYAFPEIGGVKVFSYLGDDSPAERFKRGETVAYNAGESRISFLPYGLQKLLSKAYHTAISSFEFSKRLKIAESKFEKQKIFMKDLKARGESYDVVFSTFGELENVYAGEYASKLFGCKYILDFRDLLAQRVRYSGFKYQKLLKLQKKAIQAADVITTVSESTTKELAQVHPEKVFYTLHNGYDSKDSEKNSDSINEKLVFCHTGRLYLGLSNASPLFMALSELSTEGKIHPENVEFVYAGSHYSELKEQASKFQMENIINDRGYVGKNEVQAIQNECDIFVVLSWNTKHSHGILTGKLYEGIRCKKPILTIVSGNEAESELKIMSRKYKYGFCYEEAASNTDYKGLKDWLYDAYQKKMNHLPIPCTATQEFFTDFRYDNLAGKLDGIIREVVPDRCERNTGYNENSDCSVLVSE